MLLSSKDIIFQYNSSTKNMDVGLDNKNTKLAEIIAELMNESGITNIQKHGSYLTVYQYAPVAFSDIHIGMKYNLKEEKWSYYYNHDYSNCRHNKFIYRIYDLIYNMESVYQGIGIIIGLLCIFAGVFRWYFLLAFFTWRFKPETDKGVMMLRVVSVIFGTALIYGIWIM